jgi:phospholipid transport system substrate-binding protein
MNARLRSLSLLAVLTVALPASASPHEAVSKPVKRMIQAVRYGKDALALEHFAGEEQGRLLLGAQWDKGSEAQRREFVRRLHGLISHIAFPKLRENYKNLISHTYEEPQVEGERARLRSTLVVHHAMKKKELKVEYDLVKDQGAWKLVDMTVLGDSMLEMLREEQIQPALEQGGWEHLLRLMREKEAELAQASAK